ncbi:MocR-like pyridoxine biosynthesis transcription factor PdxR [Deinococcus aquiradiocola]|uniref:GntR family transcriptional regulator n=1 Tax=Deinococcus aquiradiocola TaxID=393059 RepID=A0A917UIH0_9DEIO|nr:PLP-dependent aminotransferase family protein [Deinococcus aquiradiocola]GGJ60786.1 GntR family transcriptional regulator [Deinococcus aquiradiocola]
MSLPDLLAARPGEAQHVRVTRSLRDAVVQGHLSPGTRVSTRRLAQAWGVARNTVQDAVDQLQAEGYLEVRARSGSYVAPRGATPGPAVQDVPRVPLSGWATRALSGGRSGVPGQYDLDLRLGQSAGLFPSEVWAQALARRAGDADALLSAGELGPQETRHAIAQWLTRERGASVTPDMVMLTGGTQSALDLLSRTYLEPGRVAVMEDPGYLGARRAFEAVGATVHPVPVDAGGLDVTRLPPNPTLTYVTPGCQFPTTATLGAARRQALLAWATRTQSFILEDDYAADFHHTARPPAPLQGLAPHSVLLLGTFSQSLAPALRSGYLVAPPAVLDVLARTRPLTDRHPPTLDALALSDFLASGGYVRHLRRARTQVTHRHDVLLAALHATLPQLDVLPARAGLHLRVPLPHGQREEDVTARAARLGLGVSGAHEYASLPHAPALLLGFAHLPPDALREAARRLALALQP